MEAGEKVHHIKNQEKAAGEGMTAGVCADGFAHSCHHGAESGAAAGGRVEAVPNTDRLP